MHIKKIIFGFLLSCLAVNAVSAQISIVGQLENQFDITPGKTYEGTIEVINNGGEAQEVKAIQSDYFFYSDGTNVFGDPGSLPRSNASWIMVSPQRVVIPPGETIAFHYAIQVPDDVSLKGTYWSLIMVEPIPLTSAESTLASGKPAVGITQVVRYGIQIITQVGSTGTKLIKFNQLKLVSDGSKRSLIADVLNTGEQWLRGKFSVDLYDSNGVFVGKFTGEQKRTFPQTSVRYTVDFIGVPNGTYKALIVVDCGGDDVFGVNVNLVLKE